MADGTDMKKAAGALKQVSAPSSKKKDGKKMPKSLLNSIADTFQDGENEKAQAAKKSLDNAFGNKPAAKKPPVAPAPADEPAPASDENFDAPMKKLLMDRKKKMDAAK